MESGTRGKETGTVRNARRGAGAKAAKARGRAMERGRGRRVGSPPTHGAREANGGHRPCPAQLKRREQQVDSA
jgi:hypothetical protein